MRIYGKTLPEIFQLLPWPYKIVVTMGSAFFLFAVPYSLNFFFTLGVYTHKPGPLDFSGLPPTTKGVLDPSIAVDDKGHVLLAHTIIQNVDIDGKSLYSTNIMLERSKAPSCQSWATNTDGYMAQADALTLDNGLELPTKGLWTAETPSLVYDPDDPEKKWKLYVYEYYWNGDDEIARYYSFIGMKTAPTSDGPWSQKEWILSASPNRPPAPYSGLVKQNINTLHKDLASADVWFYSRPSVIYYKGILFMSLSAFLRGSKAPDFTVLLASTDHGRTWGYRGKLLSAADAEKAGAYTKYNGASLILHNDKPYLAAVFGNANVDGLGTFLIPFEEGAGLIQAKIQRDENGAPVIVRWVKRQSMEPSKSGGGHVAFSDKCDTGLLVSEYSDIRQSFQIFKTYKTPTSEE